MSNNYFSFKQFTIQHDRCAMKVGTDGVLLGSWVNISRGESALDIGSGSGLIALMLAQRGCSPVHAVEIDKEACAQSRENADSSPWKNIVHTFCSGIAEFDPPGGIRYRHIASNPPYFNRSLETPSAARTAARHTSSLGWDILLSESSRLLSDSGILSVILPWPDAGNFITMSGGSGFHLSRLTLVSTKEKTAPSRALIELTKTGNTPVKDHLVIQTAQGEYTPEFKLLARDFYLNL